jgi:hypothetical protein
VDLRLACRCSERFLQTADDLESNNIATMFIIVAPIFEKIGEGVIFVGHSQRKI